MSRRPVRRPERSVVGATCWLQPTFAKRIWMSWPTPFEGNPNHANVTGWPSADDETAQVMIAKEIAAVAKFVPPPESQQ